MSGFLSFPDKSEILTSLRPAVPASTWGERVCEDVAERLGGRTYDGAGFSFILMEILYEHELALGEDLTGVLPACIEALTRDRELGESAVRAYEELKRRLCA